MDPAWSFEELYRRCSPRVYRFCLSLVRDPSRAEELADDVFYKAFIAYERVAPAPDRALVWLFAIARNAAVQDLRKRARWRRWFERVGSEERHRESDTPQHLAELRADVRRVVDAITRLRPRERTLIAMRLGGELSHAEMAEILGMPEHTVAVATRRALSRLREALGGNHEST